MEVFKRTLLDAAQAGDKRKVKRCLQQGLSVDVFGESGDSPLHLACASGHLTVVDLLLRSGADPNRKNAVGRTAVHMSVMGGNYRVFDNVIDAGGDLRFHDNQGYDVRHYISSLTDNKRQNKMFNVLGRRRWLAQQLDVGEPTVRKLSILKNETLNWTFKRSSNDHSTGCTIKNLGYGQVYIDHNTVGGLAMVQLVAESSLKHDECGFTYNNGPFMVMESMYWLNTKVTVKRLHKSPPTGGKVDFLIQEYKHVSRLRHPNILLLMGQCLTKPCDSLVLVYERVHLGSLFSYLYQKVETVSAALLCEVLRQVCDAVLFLHQMALVHCGLSSHAVHLVGHGQAKLGNFEYMIQRNDTDTSVTASLLENRYPNAIYNWLAPEVLAGHLPTERSDVYSLVAIIWEVLNGMPPWSGMQAVDIKEEVVVNGNSVQVGPHLEQPFGLIMEYGLCRDPALRSLTVLQLRSMLHSYLLNEDAALVKRRHVTPLWEERTTHHRQPSTSGRPGCYQSAGVVETLIVEPHPSAQAVLERLPGTESSASGLGSPSSDAGNQTVQHAEDHSTFLGQDDSTLVQPTNTSTPVPSAHAPTRSSGLLIKPSSNGAETLTPVSPICTTEQFTSAQKQAEVSNTTDPQTTDLPDSRAEGTPDPRSELSPNPRAEGTPDITDRPLSVESQRGRRRSSSSFLSNAARKVFSRRRRSDTEESASEPDARIKERRTKRRSRGSKKATTAKPYPFDMTGISQLASDSTQSNEPEARPCQNQHPQGVHDHEGQKGDHSLATSTTAPGPAATSQSESDTSQNSTNPFKKFVNAQYEDIISDEIKAILAKPIAMPKLPSQYRRDSMLSTRSSMDQPGSVYGTLSRQWSQVSQRTRNVLSPLDNSTSYRADSRANISTQSVQSLGSHAPGSVVKPASHHTPDKSDSAAPTHTATAAPRFPPHFAFTGHTAQRNTTLPGNVTLQTRRNVTTTTRVPASHHQATAQTTGTQTSASPQGNGLPSHNSMTSAAQSSGERKVVSHRDIFFGIASSAATHVPAYRSNSMLGRLSPARSQSHTPSTPASSRGVRIPTTPLSTPHQGRAYSARGATPSRDYSFESEDRNRVGGSSVLSRESSLRTEGRDRGDSMLRARERLCISAKIANFQEKIEEHVRKQALLLRQGRSGGLSDTFHTPMHLKPSTTIRHSQNVVNYRVSQHVPNKTSQTSVATIYVDKPRVVNVSVSTAPTTGHSSQQSTASASDNGRCEENPQRYVGVTGAEGRGEESTQASMCGGRASQIVTNDYHSYVTTSVLSTTTTSSGVHANGAVLKIRRSPKSFNVAQSAQDRGEGVRRGSGSCVDGRSEPSDVRSSPGVDAHGSCSSETLVGTGKPESASIKKVYETSSETDEEVTRFVDEVMKSAHSDVTRSLAVRYTQSEHELDCYIQKKIEQTSADLSRIQLQNTDRQLELYIQARLQEATASVLHELQHKHAQRAAANNANNHNCQQSDEGSQRSSGEFCNLRPDADIEEIYFDDELDTSLCEGEDNLCLLSGGDTKTPMGNKTLFSAGKTTVRRSPRGPPAGYDDSTPQPPAHVLYIFQATVITEFSMNVVGPVSITPDPGLEKIKSPLGGYDDSTPQLPAHALSVRRFQRARVVTAALSDAENSDAPDRERSQRQYQGTPLDSLHTGRQYGGGKVQADSESETSPQREDEVKTTGVKKCDVSAVVNGVHTPGRSVEGGEQQWEAVQDHNDSADSVQV